MNVVFLDIDGVLNSAVYDRERGNGGNVDVTRLPLLREIVEAATAQVVLVSSWRTHWHAEPAHRDAIGEELDSVFRAHGIVLADKTPTEPPERAGQIVRWLEAHPETERFVILDDRRFGWGDLQPHVVNTHYRDGRGLEQEHVRAAVRILKGG